MKVALLHIQRALGFSGTDLEWSSTPTRWRSAGCRCSAAALGICSAGLMPASGLPAVHAVLATAYARGMKDAQQPAARACIEFGCIASLVIRAAFTSLRFREPISSLTDNYIDQRIALTRSIAHSGLELRI